MKESDNKKNTSIYLNLITLWVVIESMLGGIMHGLELPITGLIVGSMAVICICMIGWYVPEKGSIIKATIIVAIFKMMLSPHSPPTAYIAVFFQGAVGELIISKKYFKISCIILSVLALAESAIQKILVLILVYGIDFWKALNEFIYKIFHIHSNNNYSLRIAGIYVILHVIVGFLMGIYIGCLPDKLRIWRSDRTLFTDTFQHSVEQKTSLVEPDKKRKYSRFVFLFIWIILLILFIQASIDGRHSILLQHKVVLIMIRSFIIVLGWYLIVAPLFSKALSKWLEKKKQQNQNITGLIILLLPNMQEQMKRCWQVSDSEKGLLRIRLFIQLLLLQILHEEA